MRCDVPSHSADDDDDDKQPRKQTHTHTIFIKQNKNQAKNVYKKLKTVIRWMLLSKHIATHYNNTV